MPRALDEWVAERIERHPERSPSEILVALVHGGLRLRDGYMAVHRRTLEEYVVGAQPERYALYLHCLLDTFGPQYVQHLERWLAADGLTIAADAPA